MKEKKAKKSLRTGIYVRASTEEQAQEGFSIRAQTDKLKAYTLLKDGQRDFCYTWASYFA